MNGVRSMGLRCGGIGLPFSLSDRPVMPNGLFHRQLPGQLKPTAAVGTRSFDRP